MNDSLPWSFAPCQRDVRIVPGETSLAFYTTKNKADHAITGVATYNVQPPRAGLYFNKVQCFCFDEQRLAAHEEVDMPVLFFIDKEFLDDPLLRRVNNITPAQPPCSTLSHRNGARVSGKTRLRLTGITTCELRAQVARQGPAGFSRKAHQPCTQQSGERKIHKHNCFLFFS